MRTIPTLVAILATSVAHADLVLTAPSAQVSAGAPLELDLTITNDQAEAITMEIPNPVHIRLDTGSAVATLAFHPERSGRIAVAPREFARIRLRAIAPRDVNGPVTLAPTGVATNDLIVKVIAPATEAVAAIAVGSTPVAREAPAEVTESKFIDKPPALALSVYEPVYVIVGGDGGLNAKFQISFRYRLFDGRGKLASRLPWLDDLYLSYSQTSLWDLGELSKPFKDSSYRPRLFFGNHDLARALEGRLRIGFEAGVGHESNGKEGADSRSFNMLYLRPTLTLGPPDGLRVYAAPLIHNYIADSENPDLKNYRGYVDWIVGIGAKGGLDFWATLRRGTRSDFGSVELNASYPLAKLSGGDLTGWLMLQYFGGYGESLLDYNRKLDSQLRLGIAVAL